MFGRAACRLPFVITISASVEGLPGERLLVQRAVGIAIEKTPQLVFQLLDALYRAGNQRPGQFLIGQPLAAFDGIHEVPLDRVAGSQRHVVAALYHARATALPCGVESDALDRSAEAQHVVAANRQMNAVMRNYLLQRVSALVMAPLVVAHLALIVYAVRGGLSASEILARTHGSIGWSLFYSAFVIAAALHADIGVRNVLAEWSPLGGRAAALLAHGLGLLILVLGLRAVYAVIA